MPMIDSQFDTLRSNNGELTHVYGDNVHIMHDPTLLGRLAELCSPATFQPKVNDLLMALYRSLVERVMSRELPLIRISKPTRMAALVGDSGCLKKAGKGGSHVRLSANNPLIMLRLIRNRPLNTKSNVIVAVDNSFGKLVLKHRFV